MYRITITVKYWPMETEELTDCGGAFEPCQVIYKAELNDRKAVRRYIGYMYDKNIDSLSFTVSVKPIETREKRK